MDTDTAPVDFTDPAWLTPAEIAAELGVTADRIRALILAGKLRGVRHGLAPSSPHRIHRSWLDAYLAQHPRREGHRRSPTPPPTPPGMLTIAESAQLVGTNYHTLRKAVADGRLAAARVGTRRYIRPTDLDEYQRR